MGRVWPRHDHRGRLLNAAVRQHAMTRSLKAYVSSAAVLGYAASVAFALLYPHCHIEKEIESLGAIGATNYGSAYAVACWGLVLASPVVAWAIIGLARSRANARRSESNAA